MTINPNREAFYEFGQFLWGADVEGDLCGTFGVRPLLGRCLEPDEANPEPDVIVLLHHAWTKRLGADPDIIGRNLRIGTHPDRPVVVVGVMPPGFYLLSRDVGWIMPWTLTPIPAD